MTDEQRKKLISLYQQMYEHTHGECWGEKSSCMNPGSCCTPSACDDAIDYARSHWGIELKPTGHAKLPLMGPLGCVAEPHLRPLCTVHTCDIHKWGFKTGDPDWTKHYFKLRFDIEDLEYELAQDRVRVNRWEKGEHGTEHKLLGSGITVHLGTSDAAFPPGEGEGKMKLNTSALWFKVTDPKDRDFGFGWWARVQGGPASLHKTKGEIDRVGYTLPDAMWAEYWRTRAEQLEGKVSAMEADRDQAERFVKEFLSHPLDGDLKEAWAATAAKWAKLGWSGEPK
jgi:hypothetical protein